MVPVKGQCIDAGREILQLIANKLNIHEWAWTLAACTRELRAILPEGFALAVDAECGQLLTCVYASL